jgi:hypothetical protein
MEARVQSRRVRNVLLLCVAVLTALSLLAQVVFHLKPAFTGDGFAALWDNNREPGAATLFSILMLSGAALTLAVIAEAARPEDRPSPAVWRAVALILATLAFDEALEPHQVATSPLRWALDPLFFIWVIPGVLLLVAVAFLFRRFVLLLAPDTRRLMIIALVLFGGAGLGLEFVGLELADRYGRESLAVRLEGSIEESLEMTGEVLFLYALLLEAAHRGVGLFIRVDPPEPG